MMPKPRSCKLLIVFKLILLHQLNKYDAPTIGDVNNPPFKLAYERVSHASHFFNVPKREARILSELPELFR